jgi:hypothetical protein
MNCPKPSTGVPCFKCPEREICPQLNPPKVKPLHYHITPRPDSFKEILPLDSLEKHIYRMLLLMAEDFQLTTPERHELIFYASRFNPVSPKGGRGKSKERVFACLCLYILERDKRPIYLRNKDYFDEKYSLVNSDSEDLKKFVKKELERLRK